MTRLTSDGTFPVWEPLWFFLAEVFSLINNVAEVRPPLNAVVIVVCCLFFSLDGAELHPRL